MQLGLEGRRVLVTGGSRSIGRCIALAFAKEGARVGVVAREPDHLATLLVEMGGPEAGHAILDADLMPEGAAVSACDSLAEALGGPLDVLVHNLGGTLGIRDPLSSSKEWARVWRYNVGLAIDANNHVIPGMQDRGWGRIIHISSTAARDYRGSSPYAASKAYLNAYVATLGRAMAAGPVVVSGVAPGAIWEPDNTWEDKLRDRPEMVADFLRHHQATGRLGRATEISPFVLLLASDHATFAQGCVLPVDGGTM